MKTIIVVIIFAWVWVSMSLSALADKPSTFQSQLESSCLQHGLNAHCSLQEAYSAQLDCKEAGLPATCSIMELQHSVK